ncbi:MAG: lipoyl(octanoyl) transferase LipB [Opitutaceae bacterium]|nr:lipoyl(octanoyl) transferase LipB [Opitutaceae bacterium]
MPAAVASPLAVVDWGRTIYRDACARQAALVDQRLAGAIGDTLVFTEHDPVFTLGLRAGADSHLVWNEEKRAAEGVSVEKSNRGGDITYHGPGQIVGYPIVSLEARRDLHAYLRLLEEVVIMALRTIGLAASRRDGLTGIWVEQRKIAAIGVAVRRWTAYHGFALNVDPDLAHFSGIVPCGIAATDGTVTSLRKELGRTIGNDDVKRALEAAFRAEWTAFSSEEIPRGLRTRPR